MTVLAAVRIPGKGCVLAADSRVTGGTTIITDTCNKIVRCGSAALAISGCDGNLLGAVANARSWTELLQAAFKYTADHDKLDWAGIGYDSTSDRLWSVDSDQHILDVGTSAVGGCGGGVARGWLDAHVGQLRNLDNAKALVVGACRAAIRRDSACGGRVRTAVISR
jgi:20S proteasome alpha/beta subunit